MSEPLRRTIKRRSDEPKLEIGDTVSVHEGMVGVVVSRYLPSGTKDEVHYIAELRPNQAAKQAS